MLTHSPAKLQFAWLSEPMAFGVGRFAATTWKAWMHGGFLLYSVSRFAPQYRDLVLLRKRERERKEQRHDILESE
jgi:hypothetical protein